MESCEYNSSSSSDSNVLMIEVGQQVYKGAQLISESTCVSVLNSYSNHTACTNKTNAATRVRKQNPVQTHTHTPRSI